MAFSTAAPRAAATPARFGLTIDQLHLLQSRCPGLTLPAEFHSAWGAEVSADERAERMRAAELGLIDQGLLRADPARPDGPAQPAADAAPAFADPAFAGPADAVPADADAAPDPNFAARVHPGVRGFLGLFAEPALLLTVRSWGSGRTIVQTVAVRSGFAASLVRGQRLDDHGANPANEDAVELSAYPVTALISEALRPLRRLAPAGSASTHTASTHAAGTHAGTGRAIPAAPAGSVLLPLTLAQGVIGAIRTGDPDIIYAAALQVGLPQATRVLEGVAFGIDAGYSLAASSLTGDTLAVHWFRSASGWFELSADTPLVGSSDNAIEVADTSRVRVATSSPAAIVGQVTTAIGSLLGVLRG